MARGQNHHNDGTKGRIFNTFNDLATVPFMICPACKLRAFLLSISLYNYVHTHVAYIHTFLL